MQICSVTIPDLDLVDVKVKAGTPQNAVPMLLKQSANGGSGLDLQDEAEAIGTHRHKKAILDISSTESFRLE